jgi:protein-tyrosine phosphatase
VTDVAHITPWLCVGSRDACAGSPAEVVVHIFRSDHPGQEDRCVHQGRVNLRMDYRDGDELAPSDLRNLDVVARSLVAHRRPTLVHCAAGLCRGPTVAVYLLARVEGTHPLDACRLVQGEVYRQRGRLPNVPHRPLRQVLALWEGWRAAADAAPG